MPPVAVEILRGTQVESTASLDLAVVDSKGQLVAWAGNPDHPAFWRSSAKPFQALPLLLSGAADAWDLTPEELAITAASHGGEPRHVQLVQAILEKIQASPTDLICGSDWPITPEARHALEARNQGPTVLHNNCSGKHAGMLMLAKQLDASWRGYHDASHPVQNAIFQVVQEMTGGSEHQPLVRAIDGCGVPTFYLPLNRMAFAFAQLVDPCRLGAKMQAAAVRMAQALQQHPEIISGEGRLEHRLGVATNYRFVAKGGAEAVFCMGIPDRQWGLAMKIRDGSPRVLAPALLNVLIQLGQLDLGDRHRLDDLIDPVLLNQQGIAVGQIRSAVLVHTAHVGAVRAVATHPDVSQEPSKGQRR